MAHTSPGIDILGLICPDSGPVIPSALPPSLVLPQQNSSSSTSRSAMKCSRFREVFTASDFLTRAQSTIEGARLASPDIRVDSETSRVTSDNAHTKLAAFTVGTLSSFCMIALPPASAGDVGVVMVPPVAAESSSGSALSIERILAEQLAARFRTMSNEELVQMIEQLLQAPPLRSQTECNSSLRSPQPQSQPAAPLQSLNTLREIPKLYPDTTSPPPSPSPPPPPPPPPSPSPSQSQSSSPPSLPPAQRAPAPPSSPPESIDTTGSQATDRVKSTVTDTSPIMPDDVAKADDSGQVTGGGVRTNQGEADEVNPDMTVSLWKAWAERQNSNISATSSTSPTPTTSALFARKSLQPEGLDSLVSGRLYWQEKVLQGGRGLLAALSVILISFRISSISEARPSTWKAAISRNLPALRTDNSGRQVAGTGKEAEGEDGNRRVGGDGVMRLVQSVVGDGEVGAERLGGGSRQLGVQRMASLGGEGAPQPSDVSVRRRGRRRKMEKEEEEEELWWKAPGSVAAGISTGAAVAGREEDADVVPQGDVLAKVGVASADVAADDRAPKIVEREFRESKTRNGVTDAHVRSSRLSHVENLEESWRGVDGQAGRHVGGQAGGGGLVEGEEELRDDERGEGCSNWSRHVEGSNEGEFLKYDEGVDSGKRWEEESDRKERGGIGKSSKAVRVDGTRQGRREMEVEPLMFRDESWGEHLGSHVRWRSGIGGGQMGETNGNGASKSVRHEEGFAIRDGHSEGTEHLRVPHPYERVKGLGPDGGLGRLNHREKFEEARLGSESGDSREGGDKEKRRSGRKEEGRCMGEHGGRGVEMNVGEGKRGVLGCRLDWFIHKGVVWRRGNHGVFVQTQKGGES